MNIQELKEKLPEHDLNKFLKLYDTVLQQHPNQYITLTEFVSTNIVGMYLMNETVINFYNYIVLLIYPLISITPLTNCVDTVPIYFYIDGSPYRITLAFYT